MTSFVCQASWAKIVTQGKANSTDKSLNKVNKLKYLSIDIWFELYIGVAGSTFPSVFMVCFYLHINHCLISVALSQSLSCRRASERMACCRRSLSLSLSTPVSSVLTL